MSIKRDSSKSRTKNGLLCLVPQVRPPNATIPQAATRDVSARPEDGFRGERGHAGAAIGMLVEDGFDSEPIESLIDSLGWNIEPIDLSQFGPFTTRFWDLIVIATHGTTRPIPVICANVSRDARQRVLVISRDPNPQTIADALNSGADDYIIAPFDADECQARMRALISRSAIPSTPHSQLLWIEPMSRTVGVGSLYTTLSSREWSLLSGLIEADQQPVRADLLEERLWGSSGHHSTLASVVSRLRHRLQAHRLTGIEIDTIRGEGYAVRFHALDISLLQARGYLSANSSPGADN